MSALAYAVDPALKVVELQAASTITPERLRYLWDGVLPVGVLVALSGRGGCGKSTFGLDRLAAITRGDLPGEQCGTPQTVLLWSGEDPWPQVVVPRLIAAGADLDKVVRFLIRSLEPGGTEMTPTLPDDLELLEQAIIDSAAVAVLIDPLTSVMAGDLNKEADVRRVLDTLAGVADRTGATIMFIRHMNKGGGHPSDKMSGSHAFRDAARAVLLFAFDADAGATIMSLDKGNYTPTRELSWSFTLAEAVVPTADPDEPAVVARVTDLIATTTTVGDVINRPVNTDDDAYAEITDWLIDYVTENGPTVTAREVEAAARQAGGWSRDKLGRARRRLEQRNKASGASWVEARKLGGKGMPWAWTLISISAYAEDGGDE